MGRWDKKVRIIMYLLPLFVFPSLGPLSVLSPILSPFLLDFSHRPHYTTCIQGLVFLHSSLPRPLSLPPSLPRPLSLPPSLPRPPSLLLDTSSAVPSVLASRSWGLASLSSFARCSEALLTPSTASTCGFTSADKWTPVEESSTSEEWPLA